MQFYNVTREELERALQIVNEKYQGNIQWNGEPERKGKRIRATLRVKGYDRPGYRRGWPRYGQQGKRMPSACWHAHGDFFDALLKVQPEAVIRVGSYPNDWDVKIDRHGGNWRDRPVGMGLMFSEMCDCGKEGER